MIVYDNMCMKYWRDMKLKNNLIVVFLTCVCINSYCHSFAVYVSTPISPPEGILLWMLPVSVLLMIALNTFLCCKLGKCEEPWKAIMISCISILAFVFFFHTYGRAAARADTGPPPGLGPPYPVYWGFTWKDVGDLFLEWNLYGMIFLLLVLPLILFTWKRFVLWKVLILFLSNILLYIFCLFPFIISGAFTHGWGGSYTFHGCRERIDVLENAIIKYALENDNKLPGAKDTDELMNIIKPYIKLKNDLHYNTHLNICPVYAAYNKRSETYKWNPEMSNVPLKELESMAHANDSEIPVLECPSHPGICNVFMFYDAYERIMDEK